MAQSSTVLLGQTQPQSTFIVEFKYVKIDFRQNTSFGLECL